MQLDGPRVGPAQGGEADALVVLLHGYGADGQDLIGLAPELARVLPGAAFVSPNAPFPCEGAPFGRQWFAIWDRSDEARLAGARKAAEMLDAFLDDELAATGVGAERLALVGFSQGTMMALHVGPRRAEPLAGIVGFSGRMVAPESLAEEIKQRPPVQLIHGTADEVVPFASMAAAEASLVAAGIDVTTQDCPGIGHGIDRVGLDCAARFLASILPSSVR